MLGNIIIGAIAVGCVLLEATTFRRRGWIVVLVSLAALNFIVALTP